MDKPKTYRNSFIILLLVLVVIWGMNICLGSVSIPFSETLHSVLGGTLENTAWEYIIWNYRIPKAFTAVLVGSGLALSGLLMQTLFRNPLAGPFVLGISSGGSLGAAFQKINFLRDMKSDYNERGRVYFPGIDFKNFDNEQKETIEADIKKDFDDAFRGIVRLPKEVRFGVHVAYVYYLNLFKKIKKTNAMMVKRKRIRVNDGKKIYLFLESAVRHRFNMF